MIVNYDKYLPNVEAACDNLDGHKRKIYPIPVLQNFIHRHIVVERILEALVKRRESNLDEQIDY